MAKLNVKVIEEVIEWEGVQYRKVNRKAAVGDVVRCIGDDYEDITEGEYFNVIYSEQYGTSIVDNVGDTISATVDYPEDFEVYEKLAEAVAEPSEPSDMFTYENVQYRKVKRKANVGERVMVDQVDKGYGLFNVGNVGIVVAFSDRMSAEVRFDNGGKWYIAETSGNSSYVVLEPIPAEVTYVQDEVTYRLTVAGEKPTHFVRKPDAPNRSWVKSGKVYEITRIDGDGDYRFVGEVGDNNASILRNSIGLVRKEAVEKPESTYKPGDKVRSKSTGKIYTLTKRCPELDGHGYGLAWRHTNDSGWIGENQFELFVEEPPMPRRLTVGDFAKVIDTSNCLGAYLEGDIIEITVDDGSFAPYRGKKPDGTIGNYLSSKRIVPATKAEFDAAVAELTKPARVPVGAYVKITNGFDLPNGSIAKVTRDDEDSAPYKCELLDGSDFDYLTAGDFEVLSEADAKLAIETEAERKKWAAIGRKVNEYKTGDVVEIVANTARSENKVGDIGVVFDVSYRRTAINAGRGESSVWSDKTEIKLVTPVEQRFDLAN